MIHRCMCIMIRVYLQVAEPRAPFTLKSAAFHNTEGRMSVVGGAKKHRTCQSAESTLLSFINIKAHVSEKLWCQGEIKSWADWPSSLAAWWCSRTRPRTARLIALRLSLDGWCSTDSLYLGRSILGQRWYQKMLNVVPVGFVPSLHQHNKMGLSVYVF